MDAAQAGKCQAKWWLIRAEPKLEHYVWWGLENGRSEGSGRQQSGVDVWI